jgi:hypothetical protein
MAARVNEIRYWRAAWVALAVALALHVTDEALTGFLPVYNSIVEGIRELLMGTSAHVHLPGGCRDWFLSRFSRLTPPCHEER